MVTLINLIQWDGKIWNDVLLPEGIDRDIMVDTIVSRFGTCDCVWQNPKVFKHYNDVWFKRKYYNIAEMEKTLHYEYDPIENYRRNEQGWRNVDEDRNLTSTRQQDDTSTTKDVNDRVKSNTFGRDSTVNDTETTKTTDTETTKGTETRTTDTSSNSTATAQTAAYNSEAWVNADKTNTVATGDEVVDGETTGSRTLNGNVTRTLKHVEDTDETGKETENDTRNVTGTLDSSVNGTEKEGKDTAEKYGVLAYGNIGVTTSQQMIQQQRDLVEFDIYSWIAEMWADEFVVGVW